MENISKNALFQNVSAESIEKMIPCFDMKKRSFSEKDIISTTDGKKEYVCLLLEGAVSVSRICIDGSLDLLEYLEDTGVFGDAFAFSNQEDEFITVCEKDCSVLFIEKSQITKRCSNACSALAMSPEMPKRRISSQSNVVWPPSMRKVFSWGFAHISAYSCSQASSSSVGMHSTKRPTKMS